MPEPELNRLPALERYQRDPDFHTLVDLLANAIRNASYTPTEVREAAVLACAKIEATKPSLAYFERMHP